MKKLIYILFLLPLVLLSQKTTVLDSDMTSTVFSTSTPSGINEWEIRSDNTVGIRFSDNANSSISAGRDGTGRAAWFGVYGGNDTSRSEAFKDRALSGEQPTYWATSLRIVEPAPDTRKYFQFRNMKETSDPPTGTAAKNPISISEENGRLYFSLLTDCSKAEIVPQANGATPDAVKWPDNPEFGYGVEYDLDTWIDIVIYWSALSYTNNNTLKVWMNGDLIIDHYGCTNQRYMATGLPISGDLKNNMGVYWATLTPEGEVYFDDVKACEGAGCTYEDVSWDGNGPNTSNPITCSNGVQDGDETGVDCGGSCNNTCSANTPPTGAQFTSSGERFVLVPENTVNPAYDLEGIDVDSGETFTYTILQTANHNDAAFYSISGSTLTLNLTPDFENPVDSNVNNKYGLDIEVEDSVGNIVVQNVYFEITDVLEGTDRFNKAFQRRSTKMNGKFSKIKGN